MFKSRKVYVQVRRNKVTVIDLLNGEQVVEEASIPFSTQRIVVASFDPAHQTIKSAFGRLGVKRSLGGISIAMHQVEGFEGGLSDIEKRALVDLGQMAGGSKVVIVENESEISNSEALALLR